MEGAMNGDSSQNGIDERTERELAALADGTLQGAERQALEARVASSPVLSAALERQRAGIAALRSLEPAGAPLALRERIEAERSSPSRRVRRSRLRVFGAIAAAGVAAVVVATLVLPSGGGGPSVVEASALSELPAQEPTVATDPANPKLLAASQSGVPFPDLLANFGWREAGSRTDELDGRDTTTVFYEKGGRRIGYTILSGESIDPPGDAKAVTLNDVDLEALREGEREIVTWLREGQTCVLAGEGVSQAELLELASWKGEGDVPF
jgi:anti-sigma factor RsiW